MNEARTGFAWSLLLMLLGVIAAGLVFGWPHAAFTAVGFGAYFLYRQMQGADRLLNWVRQPFGTPPPVPTGNGVWDDVFAAMNRRHRENIAQRHELHLALDRFRLAAEALPDGVVILDESQQIEWMNRQAALCLCLDTTSDVGARISNLLREPEFENYLNDPERYGHALVLATQRVPGHSVHMQLTPFSAGRSLLLVRDTTQLARMTTMRRDFVANVSHELKTPLTVILGYLETIEDSPPGISSEELGQYVQMATTQARRMQHLVDELLTLSVLETDAPPNNDNVHITPLMASVYREALALSGGQHEIALDAETTAILHGDESELHSALLNLASNAVHYTPPGGSISMRWRVLDNGDGEFSVSDDGIGIALTDIHRLTERFFRVDKGRARLASDGTGGTGLGLSIVKQVVERHNGQLLIRSELGQGSTFSIIVPNPRVIAND
jgi:two-component system phosphate regulon sensor histidine kinase PhoR